MAVEEVKPYAADGGKTEQVEQMFDHIAPSYDFMNHAMTFGMDRMWRDRMLRQLRKRIWQKGGQRFLDVACGTGDISFSLRKRFDPCEVTGIDLSAGMLKEAEAKLKTKRYAKYRDTMRFSVADCLSLPFQDNTFDAVTVAYGVRNFADLGAGYREMLRVLRPGGALCVLELCEPGNGVVQFGYRIYSKGLIPLLGKIVSKDRKAYSYLLESIRNCPSREKMLALMKDSGFAEAGYRVLFPGTVAVYTAVKS